MELPDDGTGYAKGTWHFHGVGAWIEDTALAPLQSGASAYTFNGQVESEFIWKVRWADGSTCDGSRYDLIPLTAENGRLTVGPSSDGKSSTYSGWINRDVSITFTQVCVICDEDGCTRGTKEVTMNDTMELDLSGVVRGDTIEGTEQVATTWHYTEVWVNWDFVPRPW